jgi:Zn-dependent protease
MEEWKAFIVAIAALIFGFEGFRVISVIRYPVSYTGGVIVGAIVGFVVHELAHGWSGRKEGCIAHFVLSKIGLSLTLFFGLLRTFNIPFVILAPGYVQLYCMGSLVREDHIAAAGPLSNIVIALISKLALKVSSFPTYIFLKGFADINAWLALFNLLPFSPLDGWKIIRRSLIEWLALFLLAIIVTYLL